jgi:hypothetical protein
MSVPNVASCFEKINKLRRKIFESVMDDASGKLKT